MMENLTNTGDVDFSDRRRLKVVIDPAVAARLCDLGHPIVKIKPNKQVGNSIKNKCNTVFLFEETEPFLYDFYRLLENKK